MIFNKFPRPFMLIGALFIITGAIFKLAKLGFGFLQANTMVFAGAVLIVIALMLMAIGRLFNK